MTFELPQLPYAKDALEPHIDAKTMEIHHGKHHNGYTTKLNGALEGSEMESDSIESILANMDMSNGALRNNGGGYFNHCLFWKVMGPNGGGTPSGDLAQAIDVSYGSFEEFKTSDFVATKLEGMGLSVHRGLAGTGVVATLTSGDGDGGAIALRADMDALPLQEKGSIMHRSETPGKMHACGHDGHTTMLLGAAKYLAETQNFNGTVQFVFQPAEEGKGGGKKMIEDGLFKLLIVTVNI